MVTPRIGTGDAGSNPVLTANKIKNMKNLPEGMKPDRDNVVYYDTEKGQFYIIKWEDNGNGDTPIRYYIPLQIK